MNEWELARYLIDSKKCIDSLIYIENNFEPLSNLDLKSIIDSKLRLYYIDLCIIFDYSFNKPELKKLKSDDKIVNKIYYERDKNNAHKDIDYKKNNQKIDVLISELKNKLLHCFEVCRNSLPKEITLDYVAYDRNLFRFVNMITPEIENKLNELLYNQKKSNNNYSKDFKVFNDTEDIRSITGLNDYAVLLDNGINLKECLQNRQDACIKINVLFNQNIWVTLKASKKSLQDNENIFIKFLNEIKNRYS